MYSYNIHHGEKNLHHVKGSRSLDASSSTHTSHSDSTNGKITNMNAAAAVKQQQQKEHAHQHAHLHSHSRSNSTSTSTSSLHHKKSSSSSLNGDLPTSQHVKTNLSGTPILIDTYKDHKKFWRRESGIPEPGRSQSWSYLGYMINGFKNLVLTFYFNWPMLFTAPISSAAFLLVYPSSVLFLVLFEIGLKVFMEKWGGTQVVRYISLKFGQGFGAINWGTPELLLSDTSALLVQSTLPSLGLPATPITVSGCRRRTFDLSIAQTFVLLASLIYERDSQKVKEAYDLYAASKRKAMMRSGADSSSATIAAAANELSQVGSKMRELLWESESRIRQIAENWGLHFAGVSELKSLGGLFCGIFWSETVPFIVVVFKGTTPTNYEEFLVDATFQRTDARSFLYGCVHEGFYESLFSTTGFGQQDVRDPYGAILAAVQSKASQIQEQLNTTEPIQLWITGHSFGAALSSLLFSRWLKCPSDLSRRLVLRDAYVIGTPAVGDNDYASTFASHSNLPVTRSSTLWRIINKSDIFCRLPPGYDSKNVGHYMSESDFFNYSHVGHAIQITRNWHSKPLKCFPSSYQPPMQVNIVTNSLSSSSASFSASPTTTAGVYHQPHIQNQKPKKVALPVPSMESLPKWAKFISSTTWSEKVGNPIYFIEKMYPFFLIDHLPSQYFKGLARARVYYENEELEQTTESLGL